MDPKSPLASKLNWLGLLTLIVGLFPKVQDMIPDNLKPYAVAAVGIVTIILRTFFTSAPTTLTPPPPAGTGG
jgi:hypothetical protein